jgi:predicted dehydrogenase
MASTSRPDNPTQVENQSPLGPDYLKEMLRDRPGNVVVISGNNAKKSRYILECVKAGLNVMADKPMAINPEGLALDRGSIQGGRGEKTRAFGHHDRAP